MTLEEKISNLEEAQDLLRQAVELIEEATKGSENEAYTDAYLTSNIKIHIDDESGYVTSAPNLSKIIEELQVEAEFENEEE